MTSTARSDRWVRCFHPSADRKLRLVCFPHAGGSASYYFSLSQALTPNVEVLAMQYPGRQDRRLEACIDNIPELAEASLEALQGWLSHPFAFFGHSLGAVLAFEVAQRLRYRSGAQPLWLFASGRRAPSRHRASENIHLRDDAALVNELRRGGGTDPAALRDPELLAAFLPIIRNDFKAIETYECVTTVPLACPITALVGNADPQATIDETSAWAVHSSQGFDLRVFPGGHFYLESSRAAVIDTIAATLDKVSAASM